MDISVITVTHNSKQFIGKLSNSLKQAAHGVHIEHIVVDNASIDGTAQYIKDKLPNITLIENKENLGFGHANNQAYKYSTGRYVLFLNPDMKVNPGSLKILLEWMETHRTTGIAGVQLRNEFGQQNLQATPRAFPTVHDLVFEVLKVPHVIKKVHNKYLMRGEDFTKEQEVDSVRGAFMMVRRELLDKLGWAFDPRYYIWFEDVDLCAEAKQHGYKVMYTPSIAATDYVGQSFKQKPSMWKQKQYTKSMVQYAKKWMPWYKWMWVAAVRPVGIAMTWIHSHFSR